MSKPFALDFLPGSQRDGTKLDGKQRYLDMLWARFRLGRPRKMGGYRRITDALYGPARRIHLFYTGAQIIAHVGTTNGIQQVIFTTDGTLVSVVDRTPATFAGGVNVGFTFDAIFDTTSSVVQLVAHAALDSLHIADDTRSTPFIGQIDSATPLAPFTAPGSVFGGSWTQPSIAGGVFCVQPFVFDFDSDGYVAWSAANLPLTLGVTGGTSGAGQARVSAQKVIAGMALRGGGSQSPAAVIWTMSEVITATFVGISSGTFAFNTISPSSSILSSACVIEYDGLYFWVGVDRFLVFNGTVTEVPNDQNKDWFFDNLTPGYTARTFAFKVPRYGEIWFCACMFGSTEPNYAVIFNLQQNCWYDTALPADGRGAGYFAQGFRYPIMTDTTMEGSGYGLWMHEYGLDRVAGTDMQAIRSYFETGWFGGPVNNPPADEGLNIHQLEPDIEQSGDLTVYLIGAANARATEVSGDTVPILKVPSVAQEQFASFTPRQSLRLARLHVESNVLGGNYVVGRNIMHGDVGGARLFS